ncbi:TPA: (2Fe-2S)-binding protein [Citrobacter freundii]
MAGYRVVCCLFYRLAGRTLPPVLTVRTTRAL